MRGIYSGMVHRSKAPTESWWNGINLVRLATSTTNNFHRINHLYKYVAFNWNHSTVFATLAWTVNLPWRLILAKLSRPGFFIFVASDSFETFSIEIFVKDWCRRWYYRGSTTVTQCLPGCQRRLSNHFRDWSTQQHVMWRISGPTTV